MAIIAGDISVTNSEIEQEQEDGIPRRIRLDRMSPAELAIVEAIRLVEEAGCDTMLTDAVILLDAAKNRVADFVDRQLAKPDSKE